MTRRCRICESDHSEALKCNFDRMAELIGELRGEKLYLLREMKVVTDTAVQLRSTIRQIQPEIRRLLEIEEQFNKLTWGNKNVGGK